MSTVVCAFAYCSKTLFDWEHLDRPYLSRACLLANHPNEIPAISFDVASSQRTTITGRSKKRPYFLGKPSREAHDLEAQLPNDL